MRIVTARYRDWDAIKAGKFAPVGTTVGFPRWLGYRLAGLCPLVTPHGIFGENLTDEEYREQYFERIGKFGPVKIRALLEAIVESYEFDGSGGVALCCFCDVSEEECHRRLFAEWWTAVTGEKVDELQDVQLVIE
jgi:hypothetical protein